MRSRHKIIFGDVDWFRAKDPNYEEKRFVWNYFNDGFGFECGTVPP